VHLNRLEEDDKVASISYFDEQAKIEEEPPAK
jgi:hypothetical protein